MKRIAAVVVVVAAGAALAAAMLHGSGSASCCGTVSCEPPVAAVAAQPAPTPTLAPTPAPPRPQPAQPAAILGEIRPRGQVVYVTVEVDTKSVLNGERR